MTARKPMVIGASGQQQELQAGDTLSGVVQNLGGAPSVQEGTHAARPAAGNAGAIYIETDTNTLFRDNGTSWVAIGTSLTIGFILNSGATGTSVAPRQVAPRSGLITKCKVVTNASDGSTDLTFRIRQNGTDVFSSDPTVTHGAAAGTLSTFTTLTSSPLSVAADDVFSIDVTSGTASWQVTIQLET